MKRLILLATCFAAPLLAVESNSTMVECQKSNVIRKVEVKRTSNGTSEACEVIYHKPTEGQQPNTLWSADQQKGYCDQKAASFVQKQESWGFSCTGQASLSMGGVLSNETGTNAADTTKQIDTQSVTGKAKDMMNQATDKMKDATDSMKAGTGSAKEMLDKGTSNIKEKMNETTKSMMEKAKAKASEATGNAVDSTKQKAGDAMNKVMGK